MSWEEGLSESAFWFQHVVWPWVGTHFGCFWGTTLVPNEGTEARQSRLLDAVGGVDYWLLREDPLTMVGLASRVSYGPPAYDTFTVGIQESEKRLAAMRCGEAAAFPEFTIQASVDRSRRRLLGAWATKTDDLFNYVDANRDDLPVRANKDSGKPFYVVWLEDYKTPERRLWAYWSPGTDYALRGGGTVYVGESDDPYWCDGCGLRTSGEQRAEEYRTALGEVAGLLKQYRPQTDLREAMERVTGWGYTRTIEHCAGDRTPPSMGELIADMRTAAMEFMSLSKAPWTAMWQGRCHRCGGIIGSERAA
jgi:hypothetical protein